MLSNFDFPGFFFRGESWRGSLIAQYFRSELCRTHLVASYVTYVQALGGNELAFWKLQRGHDVSTSLPPT